MEETEQAHATAPEQPPVQRAELAELKAELARLTHVLGLAVLTMDKHSRLLDRRLAQRATEGLDGLVTVKRGADGSQTITVRDTTAATQAVKATVEAATQDQDPDEWGTY